MPVILSQMDGAILYPIYIIISNADNKSSQSPQYISKMPFVVMYN